MTEIFELVSPGYLAPEGIRVSKIEAGQPKLPVGRWMSSNRYCAAEQFRATEAPYSAGDFDLPRHDAVLMTTPTTDVPTTGVPPSALERRT